MAGDGDGRMRADLLLVERGLFESRARARAAIEAGLVRADGRPVAKPADAVSRGARIEAEAPHPWVSRAGVKLAAALDAFEIDVEGRVAVDLGASTGGFTDVLLARGAARVTAVDVGHGQLHPRVAADPRVRSLEGVDARALAPEHLEGAAPDLLVADLSFIGLAKAVGPALRLLAPRADWVALVKPQFEAGPARVGRGGIVAPDVAEVVTRETVEALDGVEGFKLQGLIESPIAGGDGNRERVAWFVRFG